MWLVLFQGGTTSIFTLAAVSFTVGLVTREVVEALIKFVTSKVTPQPSDTKDDKDRNEQASSAKTTPAGK